MELIIASANAHKIEEISRLLPKSVCLTSAREVGVTEDIPETADTLEGNALLKARYIYERTGKNCFADDTGLEVNALDGAPGVHSARYATDGHDHEANIDLLLKNLSNKSDRTAQFRTVIALIIDGNEHLFEGIVKGEILAKRTGTEGFGYDAIFMAEGTNISFAEMDLDKKNAISHRGRATSKLIDFICRQ